ncbi:MAG: hypothetical protein ABR606_13965 [Vicinamibacterales bacterium]
MLATRELSKLANVLFTYELAGRQSARLTSLTNVDPVLASRQCRGSSPLAGDHVTPS